MAGLACWYWTTFRFQPAALAACRTPTRIWAHAESSQFSHTNVLPFGGAVFSGVVTPSSVGAFSHLAAVAWAALTAGELALADAEPPEAELPELEPPELEHALRITIANAHDRAAKIFGRAITLVRTGLVIVVPACG